MTIMALQKHKLLLKVTNKAITDIQQLPDGTAKETLLSLTELLLHRSF